MSSTKSGPQPELNLLPILLQTLVVRIMPDIVSKLLHAAIWSSCAVQFESEQTPFPRIGHRLRSAALHRIQLGTWGFDPISYFYSETNEWFQHWAKQWAWLQSATTSCLFSRKFHFTWKKIIVAALHPWLSNWVSIARVVAHVLQASL